MLSKTGLLIVLKQQANPANVHDGVAGDEGDGAGEGGTGTSGLGEGLCVKQLIGLYVAVIGARIAGGFSIVGLFGRQAAHCAAMMQLLLFSNPYLDITLNQVSIN